VVVSGDCEVVVTGFRFRDRECRAVGRGVVEGFDPAVPLGEPGGGIDPVGVLVGEGGAEAADDEQRQAIGGVGVDLFEGGDEVGGPGVVPGEILDGVVGGHRDVGLVEDLETPLVVRRGEGG